VTSDLTGFSLTAERRPESLWSLHRLAANPEGSDGGGSNPSRLLAAKRGSMLIRQTD